MELLACGSSSNSAPSRDAEADTTYTEDVAQTCEAFSAPGCRPGETCCLSDRMGTCTASTACASPLHFECMGPAGCKAGQLCCATVPLGLDASILNTAAGGPVVVGVTATSRCATSCASPSYSLCRTSADCPGAAACDQLPEGDVLLLALGAETLTVCSSDAGVASFEEGGFPDGSSSQGDGSVGADGH
jgi:hypothetical protein